MRSKAPQGIRAAAGIEDAAGSDGADGGEYAARTIHLVSAVEGRWLGRYPQQQAGDALRLRGQRQLAAGDKIELPRFTPDFQHHDTQRIAGQRVGGRLQGGVPQSAARTVTRTRGSRPNSANPLIDSAPDSISAKS